MWFKYLYKISNEVNAIKQMVSDMKDDSTYDESFDEDEKKILDYIDKIDFTDIDVKDARKLLSVLNNINTNLLTAAQSQSCPSNPIIYFSRTVVREYTVGSAGVPISINNSDTVQINFDVGASINIGNNNGCQPAIGLEFDVEFIRTSPNITCYNFFYSVFFCI
jgi:hypothetical protein